MKKNIAHVFLDLVRAGLWEKDARLLQYGEYDIKEVFCYAEEQTVVGLVAAGIDHIVDAKLPKEDILTFVGRAIQLERRNISMNVFIAYLVMEMRKVGIYALLVKGQGVAQCYERPSWREAGDIDLFLSEVNYHKAIDYLTPKASYVSEENPFNKHIALIIDNWSVELHGTLRGLLSKRFDREIDQVQDDVFSSGSVRSWLNGDTQIYLPKADNDAVFIFSHILQHYFKEGIRLRQICDWCRLLWAYRNKIDRELLKKRIEAMGAMTEWRTFAAISVDYLGIPSDDMPLYHSSKRWKRKAKRILNDILEEGHNRKVCCNVKATYTQRKLHSFWQHTKSGMKHFFVFPIDTIIVWWNMVANGLRIVIYK